MVGAAQQLSILKEVSVVGGSGALPGSQLEYVIRVTNIGSLPATHVVVTDDLGPLAGQVSYVAGSGSLNGSAAGVAFAGSVLSADYAAQYGDLPPGAEAVVRFRVQIDPTVAIGTTLTNTGVVSWNDPAQTASAAVSLDVGGTPGSGTLNGRVWHDASLDKVYDSSEKAARRLVRRALSGQPSSWRPCPPTPAAPGASAAWRPTRDTSEPYELRFRPPGAGPNTASLGNADSPFTNGPQRISGITVASGGNLQGLNLPITPNGVVYNSVQRTPVAGARLALLNAATDAPLPSQLLR